MGVGETYNWKPKEFEIQCEVLEILPESRWDIANLGNIGFSQGYTVLFLRLASRIFLDPILFGKLFPNETLQQDIFPKVMDLMMF